MASDDLKREAARAALAEVQSGMKLGLGTGSTARHFVDLLAEKVRQGLNCVGVPTSEATTAQARELGIPIATLDDIPELDLTVDGADEVGPGLALIKGAGGALLWEKIVASASRRMIVIADDSKLVDELGRFPLPIEVNVFGLASTTRKLAFVLADFGAEGGLKLRTGGAGQPFKTDGGHLILDASFGRISKPEALATALSAVPGVVEHGLFIGLCKRAYVAGPNGIEILDA